MARRYRLDPIKKSKSVGNPYEDLFGPSQVEPLGLNDSFDPGSGSDSALDQTKSGREFGDRTLSGGRGGDQAGGAMSQSEAAAAHSVANATNAPAAAQAALPGLAGLAASGAVEGLQSLTGVHGVVGGPVAPAVNTAAFDQQTPAKDTPVGVPDAGAQAAAANNPDLSPQAAFGNQAAPAPDMMGVDPMGDISAALGINNAQDPVGVAANAPMGGPTGGPSGGSMGGAPGANSDPGSPGPGVGGGPNGASGGSPGGPGTAGGDPGGPAGSAGGNGAF